LHDPFMAIVHFLGFAGDPPRLKITDKGPHRYPVPSNRFFLLGVIPNTAFLAGFLSRGFSKPSSLLPLPPLKGGAGNPPLLSILLRGMASGNEFGVPPFRRCEICQRYSRVEAGPAQGRDQGNPPLSGFFLFPCPPVSIFFRRSLTTEQLTTGH